MLKFVWKSKQLKLCQTSNNQACYNINLTCVKHAKTPILTCVIHAKKLNLSFVKHARIQL